MENVIDFLEYKRKIEQKESDEIDSLRAELASLIEEMGGVHIVPMLLQSSYCESCLDPLPQSSAPVLDSSYYSCFSYYTDDHGQDGNKK